MAERKIGDKVMRLVRGDITDMEVEAFVFVITSDCKLGSGYGGAIAQRGGKKVQEALDEIGYLGTGEAVMTTAGNMKAKHIIHANGPKYNEPNTEAKLAAATESALRLADAHGIAQIALPPMGTGLYQVPLDLCARVMVDTVAKYLESESSLKEVSFVALDNRELAPLQAAIEKGA